MTLEQLKKVHESRPFRPFTMHMAGGRSVHVPHPEMMWVPPRASRTVYIEVGADVSEFVDLLLVASIELGGAKSTRNGKSKNGR